MRQNLRRHAGMLAGLSTFIIFMICMSPFILVILLFLVLGLLAISIGPKSTVQKTNMKCFQIQTKLGQHFFKRMMSNRRR